MDLRRGRGAHRRIIGEDAALSELERLVVDADDERLLLECPAGVGYQPTQDSASEEIEGALSELRRATTGSATTFSASCASCRRRRRSPQRVPLAAAPPQLPPSTNSQRFENYLDENKAMWRTRRCSIVYVIGSRSCSISFRCAGDRLRRATAAGRSARDCAQGRRAEIGGRHRLNHGHTTHRW